MYNILHKLNEDPVYVKLKILMPEKIQFRKHKQK